MDKSKKYIKLCDLADEIQCRWVQRYGDFYLGNNGRITCWLANADPGKKVKKRFVICSEDDVIRLSKYVWLPRQNQLIEMAQIPGRRYDTVVQDFYDWTKAGYNRQSVLPGKLFPSMEQIWLAYVMQRKFLKKWEADAWVAI